MADWRPLRGRAAVEDIIAGTGNLIEVRYPWSDDITVMLVHGVCTGTAPDVYWAVVCQGGRIAVGGDPDDPSLFAYGLICGARGARTSGAILIGYLAVEGAEYRWTQTGPSSSS